MKLVNRYKLEMVIWLKKLKKKRFINEKINEKEELEKLLRKETDRQLNNFSTIFFNKIKKNIIIDEI